jgi:hypothetical protein
MAFTPSKARPGAQAKEEWTLSPWNETRERWRRAILMARGLGTAVKVILELLLMHADYKKFLASGQLVAYPGQGRLAKMTDRHEANVRTAIDHALVDRIIEIVQRSGPNGTTNHYQFNFDWLTETEAELEKIAVLGLWQDARLPQPKPEGASEIASLRNRAPPPSEIASPPLAKSLAAPLRNRALTSDEDTKRETREEKQERVRASRASHSVSASRLPDEGKQRSVNRPGRLPPKGESSQGVVKPLAKNPPKAGTPLRRAIRADATFDGWLPGTDIAEWAAENRPDLEGPCDPRRVDAWKDHCRAYDKMPRNCAADYRNWLRRERIISLDDLEPAEPVSGATPKRGWLPPDQYKTQKLANELREQERDLQKAEEKERQSLADHEAQKREEDRKLEEDVSSLTGIELPAAQIKAAVTLVYDIHPSADEEATASFWDGLRDGKPWIRPALEHLLALVERKQEGLFSRDEHRRAWERYRDIRNGKR